METNVDEENGSQAEPTGLEEPAGLCHAEPTGLEPTERRRGATAVEYALIVALIAGLIVGVVGLVGGRAGELYQEPVNGLADHGW